MHNLNKVVLSHYDYMVGDLEKVSRREIIEKYIREGNYDSALKSLEKLLEINPKDAEAMSTLGYVHYLLDFRHMSKEEVMKLLKTAINFNKKLPLIWRYMGLINVSNNEFEKAIKNYKKAIKLDPTIKEVWHDMGLAHSYKKEYSDAINNFKEAIKYDAEDASPWINLADAYLKGNKTESAKLCLKEALQVSKKDNQIVVIWVNYANCYERENQLNYSLYCL